MGWIQTYSGRKVDPLALTVSDIVIQDIAHALSNQCRFSGHTKQHYSVAQHSLLVCNLLEEETNDPEILLEGLLHDAAEAYLVDLPSPLKDKMPAYSDAEERAQEIIYQAFDIRTRSKHKVKAADLMLLAVEVRDLMHSSNTWVTKPLADPDRKVAAMTPKEARGAFLTRFVELKSALERKRLKEALQ